ncbi:MAG: SRPBCC domain-containing protein [Pseudomonadota bacterium]
MTEDVILACLHPKVGTIGADMQTTKISRAIAASPSAVWRVLTDAQTLQTGEFGILRIEGTIATGEKIKLWSEVSPDRAFTLKVTETEPPFAMVWTGGMPLGLFTGKRTFRLEEDNGGTRFTMQETFTGLLAGLITKSMPDLNPSFQKFAEALASHSQADQS